MLREKLGIPADQEILPVMIGAGLNKNFNNPVQLQRYSDAAMMTHGAVVVGSITEKPSPGNDGDLEYDGGDYTVNAWGMPNDGVDAMPQSAPFSNLIVSCAGKTVEEYVRLYNRLWNWGLGIELNCGCPNTGSGSRIMSFDPDAMKHVLQHIEYWLQLRTSDEQRQIVGIKLSPYSDPKLLEEVAMMLCRFRGTLDYVATCNTFPNAKGFRRHPRDGRSAIICPTTRNRGGLGGNALRQISLGQAEQFVEIFAVENVEIGVVRVGGIYDGLDILESQDIGCTGVQTVSAVNGNINRTYHMIDEYAMAVA